MPPKAKAEKTMSETDSTLLAAIIKYLPSDAINWEVVSNDIGASVSTVKKQWSRYKIKHNLQQNGAGGNPDSDVKSSGKKRKRKVSEHHEIVEVGAQQAQEMATPTTKEEGGTKIGSKQDGKTTGKDASTSDDNDARDDYGINFYDA